MTSEGLVTELIEYPESEKDHYSKVSQNILKSFK